MQENLPQIISAFRDERDADSPSVQAKTHKQIAQLCEELSTIVPKIIDAKADSSVSNLIGRQREIFKGIDAILATEEAAEAQTRLREGEGEADLIRIDLDYNRKVLSMLSQ